MSARSRLGIALLLLVAPALPFAQRAAPPSVSDRLKTALDEWRVSVAYMQDRVIRWACRTK